MSDLLDMHVVQLDKDLQGLESELEASRLPHGIFKYLYRTTCTIYSPENHLAYVKILSKARR